MVELLTLNVESRETVGKRRNRRLRESGKTPAVLYGHKQDVLNLQVATDAVEAALRHGSRFVQLRGAVSERAFIKEVQWNVWGDVILHVDFTRVSEHEHVQLSVPLVLRGEALGVKDGGVVKQHLHMVEIETEPTSAPENLPVNINDLAFNQAIRIADLSVPEGVKILADPDTVVVECVAQQEIVETEEDEAGENEPEVIGRKKEEDAE